MSPFELVDDAGFDKLVEHRKRQHLRQRQRSEQLLFFNRSPVPVEGPEDFPENQQLVFAAQFQAQLFLAEPVEEPAADVLVDERHLRPEQRDLP